MCEFCNGKRIEDDRYEFGIGKDCEASKNKGYVMWCIFKKFNHGGTIHINYCPICGEELTKNKMKVLQILKCKVAKYGNQKNKSINRAVTKEIR